MLMFEASYRLWKDGGKQSVPAPWDPDTPGIPVWYNRIAMIAPELKRAGVTHVLLPPSTKTQSGDKPTGDGFGKFDDYDIGSKDQCGSVRTRFGTRDELIRNVAVLNANGMHAMGEAVLHQYDGGQHDGVYVYKDALGHMPTLTSMPVIEPDGTKWIRWAITGGGRFPKLQPCFWKDPANPNQTIPPFVKVDDVWNPNPNFPFGNGVAVQRSQPDDYMAKELINAMDWLVRTAGMDGGMRVDDVKGMYAPYIHRFLTSRAMANLWAFAEDFEGDPQQLHDWVWGPWSSMNGRCSVLDFTTHWHLQDVFDKGFPMSHLNGAGYCYRDPFHAVTFVDSPDTDSSFDQQIVNCKKLAYALICTWEGVPQIFYRDWAKDSQCYGLKHWINNMGWVNRMLADGPCVTRYVDHDCIVLNRTAGSGKPGLLTAVNRDTWNSRTLHNVQTAFWPGTHLHDFSGHAPDVWCDGEGRIPEMTVPSNRDNAGDSYVFYSWAGMEGKPIEIHVRPTLQTFFGADDLDIPAAAPKLTSKVQRIWCRANTRITLTEITGAEPLAFLVTGPDGATLATVPVDRPATGRIGFSVSERGWQQILVTNFNEVARIPFTVTVEYTAPAELTADDF